MTEKMKTVCIGRYLVDVPVRGELGFSGTMLDGFEITTVVESETSFRERIAAREAEIEARPPDAATNTEAGMVEARDLRIPGLVGRTFIYGRSRGYLMEGERRVPSESVSIESHAHLNGVSFSLSASSTDAMSAKEAEALFTRIQLRGEDEIPTVSGFCTWRAVFVDPLPAHNSEHMIMHLGLAEHPDLNLTLASIAGARPAAGLLARTAETDATIGPDMLLRMTKLRQGQRRINGVDGEEMLLRAREYNFATTYGFNWEARGKTDDPMHPFLALELRTGINERPGGKPVDTSLHEDALLSLWDSIASSIRLRKGGTPPSSAVPPEPSGPKLGAIASAGEICQQSGWWRCNAHAEGMSVHGGSVQYIRQGERMPQALLLPRQTIWQKLKRVQPSIESPQPTTWTLVDKRLRPRTAITVALAPAAIPAEQARADATQARPVPIGSHVRTGDVCLASGWWRCEEAHALDGTRWFARGSLMPVATFQVPAGVFAKSTGPEVIQRRSMWQLVRHAEASAAARAGSPTSDGMPIDEPPATA